MGRLTDFVRVNMLRDPVAQRSFWDQLARDWLDATRRPVSLAEPMQEAAEELGFGPKSIIFEIYDDVLSCLDALARRGIQVGVISNWDYSLHRVLQMFGIYDRFVTVKASLEEGIEKPDPRLFEIALHEAGFAPEDALHVGDDPVDDIAGAQSAGLRAIRIDRGLPATQLPVIASLRDLPEALDWIG